MRAFRSRICPTWFCPSWLGRLVTFPPPNSNPASYLSLADVLALRNVDKRCRALASDYNRCFAMLQQIKERVFQRAEGVTQGIIFFVANPLCLTSFSELDALLGTIFRNRGRAEIQKEHKWTIPPFFNPPLPRRSGFRIIDSGGVPARPRPRFRGSRDHPIPTSNPM